LSREMCLWQRFWFFLCEPNVVNEANLAVYIFQEGQVPLLAMSAGAQDAGAPLQGAATLQI